MPRARTSLMQSLELAGIAYRRRIRRLLEGEVQGNIGNSRRQQQQAPTEERQRQDTEQPVPIEQQRPDHAEVQIQREQNNFAFFMKIFGILVSIAIIFFAIAWLSCWIYIYAGKICEISCTERWNNLHRRNPLDFKAWKKILCPFVVENNCTYPLRITLIDISDKFIPYNQNELWISNNMYGSYFLHANFEQCASEYQKYKKENREIEYFFHDPSTHAVQRKHELRNTSSPYLSIFKNGCKYRSEAVRKQTTFFSIRHFIENQELLTRSLVFQLFGANKSDCFPTRIFRELLTFITAIDFKTGCYEFSNTSPSHENLSIEQAFFRGKTFVSDDDMTYLSDWILFRFSVYFLFLYIAYTVWGLTRQMLTLGNMYYFAANLKYLQKKVQAMYGVLLLSQPIKHWQIIF
ncbi:unnamed protein product [Mytilus edulis]|uniref:Uncharacterized protein n=1 Tax=Mytilus edulis TaxID=6550 RepID=A0A8S3UZJ2_MYTED|nr:unnamed protein product [Mytilus edulis]